MEGQERSGARLVHSLQVPRRSLFSLHTRSLTDSEHIFLVLKHTQYLVGVGSIILLHHV
jgi:hypothetical protein